MQTIIINGEPVSFPDSMSDAEIVAAIKAQNQEPEPLSLTDSIGGGIGTLNKGIMLGLNDEAAGLMSAINPLSAGDGYLSNMGERYKQGRDDAKGLQSQFDEENPVVSPLLEVGGSLATGALAAPKMLAMSGALAAPTMSLKGISKSSQIGALGGATYGYGVADGDAAGHLTRKDYWDAGVDTAKSMGVNAAAGAILSPVTDSLMAAGTSVTRAVKNRVNRTTENQAADLMGEVLAADGVTSQEAYSKLQKLGSEGILADVGPNLTSTADVLAIDIGQVKKKASAILKSRQMGSSDGQSSQQDRIMDDTAGILNVEPSEFRGTIKSMNNARFERAKPLYEEAEQVPVEVTEKLKSLYKRGSVKRAMKKVKNIADEQGIDLGDIDWNNPTLKQIDTLKQSLDQQVGVKKRAGNNEWKLINNTKNELLEIIDEQNPAYKSARNTWESDTKTMEAADYGRRILREDAEEVAENVANMSSTERDSFVMGAIKAIEDKVSATPDVANTMKRIVGSPALRKKLRNAFPDDESFDEFISTMEREATFSNTRTLVGQGSQTEIRRLARERLGMAAEGKGIVEMSIDGLNQSKVGMVASVLGKLKRRSLGQDVGEEVGNLLTKKGLTEEELQQMLSKKQRQSMIPQLMPYGNYSTPAALSGLEYGGMLNP